MYNVRNTSGRNLAIMLEKGGFIMRPNSYLDLDKFCSRKWIAANFDVRKLMRTGHLQLVHDSYAALAQAPVKNIQRPAPVTVIPKKVVSREPVQVVDLANMPDVEVDDNKRIHLPEKTAQEDTPQPVAVAEVAEPAPVVDEVALVMPVAEEPAPVDVLAVDETPEKPVEKVKREDDIFSGFDASRTPKLKRRKR